MLIYKIGDVTKPEKRPGINLILHVVNDVGRMGSGVALALLKRWPKVRSEYIRWYRDMEWAEGSEEVIPFVLGQVQILKVDHNLWIGNMVAQRDIVPYDGLQMARLDSLRECLRRIANMNNNTQLPMNIIMPRVCSGIGEAYWGDVRDMINQELGDTKRFTVSVYDLQAVADTIYENSELIEK